MITGPGLLEVYVNSPVEDVMVQATLTEVRPDGNETLIQSGWLNLNHRAASINGLDLYRTYNLTDLSPMPLDECDSATIVIPFGCTRHTPEFFATSLNNNPSEDHGTGESKTPLYDNTPTFKVGYGDLYPSSINENTSKHRYP